MDNLLKFNFLKTTETKKIDEISINNNNTNKSLEESDMSGEKFFLSEEVIEGVNNSKNDNLNEDVSKLLKANKKQKNLNLVDNDIIATNSNLIKNEENLNKNSISEGNILNKINPTKINDLKNLENKKLFKNKANIISEKQRDKENEINIDKNLNFSDKGNLITKKNQFSDILPKTKSNNKSRIKSFFQNYINYTSKKYTKKNLNHQLISFKRKDKFDHIPFKSLDNDESINLKQNDNIETKIKNINLINTDNSSKDQNNINENNIKDKGLKNYPNFTDGSMDKFDRLKNILNIRSIDAQERFTQILESNIKMNNNRFEIQLKPENLGKIHITLEISGQNVDININSDNINTIQSLTENNANLQKMLQNHGMNLNNFNFNGNNNKERGKEAQNSSRINEEKASVDSEKNIKTEKEKMSNNLVYVKA